MTTLKHNKKRNTIFLYEALVLELTKAILQKNESIKQKILEVLKEHFSPVTAMAKELELYKTIVESKELDLQIAERLLFESKRQHSKLNKKQIFNEQSALISVINRSLTNKIFANFVPNYKNIATISQIFNNEDLTPKKRVIFEQTIVRSMSKVKNSNEKAKLDPVDNIVYKSFAKNFNSEYSGLLEEQRKLLKSFVGSFADGGAEFNSHLNEEIGRLKNKVKRALGMPTVKENTLVKEKVKDVLDLMESFKERPIDKDMLQQVLKIQQLVKELNN